MSASIDMTPYREGILRDLARVMAIPSVESEALHGMPFGGECARVIEEVMDIARELGLSAHNDDNYAMHAEIGAGDEYVAVLNHVDVVPAGEGWEGDPYVMAVRDGRAYGRGVSDNKGPAIVSLYCLKALKDLGIPLKHRVRVILGANEESGMLDMQHYFKHQPLPLYGFTSDAGYPICNREKGILGLRFTANGSNTTPILSMKAGLAHNMVPEMCGALLREGSIPEGMEGTADSGGMRVSVRGRAAHASTPEKGENAAASMLERLRGLYAGDESPIGRFLAFADERIGRESDAASLGARMSDAESGALTLNMGLLSVEDGAAWLQTDIRYPVTRNMEDIVNAAVAAAAPYGVTVEIISHKEPLFVPDDHPLILALSEAYRAATGEEATTFSMGGGTYARSLMNRGVAFGASFGEDDNNVHQPNESIDIDALMRHADICASALAALAGI